MVGVIPQINVGNTAMPISGIGIPAYIQMLQLPMTARVLLDAVLPWMEATSNTIGV